MKIECCDLCKKPLRGIYQDDNGTIWDDISFQEKVFFMTDSWTEYLSICGHCRAELAKIRVKENRMSDLINRQTLKDAIDKRRLGRDARNDYEFGCENMLDWAEFMVENLPSAERKGKWVNDIAYYDEDGYPCIVTRCNMCEEVSPISNFCPNCGADMRGEEE